MPGMDILFVATVSLVATDASTRELLRGSLGLPLAGQSPGDEYVFSEKIGGCKHRYLLVDGRLPCFLSRYLPSASRRSPKYPANSSTHRATSPSGLGSRR